MNETTLDTAAYDNLILDPTWYTTDDHWGAFRELRDNDPVHWTKDRYFGKDYWLLTRHEHVRDLLMDNDKFSSRLGTRVPRTPKRGTPEERYALHQITQISHLDEPLHSLYRRPMNKHFSAPAVARMGHSIDDFVDDLIAELAPKGRIDLIEDVAAELPVRVVLRLLGVPEEDWPALRLASWQFLAAADPRFMMDNDPVATSIYGRTRLIEYGTKLALDRRKSPKDDFATLVGEVEIDGDKLSVHEMATWFVSIISGGLATTRNAIGVGAWLFMKHPEQRTKLLEDPSLMKTAVEEILRWNAPARNRLRVANEDVDFHGTRIKAGDWVVGILSSANRDEREFESPDEFDITRKHNPHLSLGAGVHMCLGRALVRLEISALMPKLLSAIPDMQPVDERPKWIPDAAAGGFSSMEVTFTPTKYGPANE